MNDARYNIKEKELEKVDQMQTQGYVSRFEHSTLRPRLHTEVFSLTRPHRTSHTGNLHEDLGKYNLGVHNSSLNKYNLSLEARHKANTISTSQMRDRHNATQPQSPHT